MKSQRSTDQSRIEREAREWFVELLDQQHDDARLATWEIWMSANEDHRRAFDEVAELWVLSGARETSAVSAVTPRRPHHPLTRRRLSYSPKILVPIAAALAVALGLPLMLHTTDLAGGKDKAIDITTSRAERRNVTLTDGSIVQMSPMTILHVDYKRHLRLLQLEQGEVLFHVQHDTNRPFRVSTKAGDIVAVGTAFDVHVQRQAVSLFVSEGTVSVGPSDAQIAVPLSLATGSTVRVGIGHAVVLSGPSNRPRITIVSAPAGATWTEGRLEYRNQPLGLVIEDVNRYARSPLVLSDPDLAALSYTGTVQIDEIDGWVQALSTAFPLSIRARGDGALVLEKNSR